MATGNNDYLPIAISGTAPVESQAAYASSVPANGRGAGVFPKEVFNKMVRQASSMAAAIGGFISGRGFNANDDGNIANLTAAFTAAIQSLVSASTSAPVWGAAYNTNTAIHTLSVTLTLPTGQWLVKAEASIFTSIYYSQQLLINGTPVMSMPNLGDQDGTDFVPMAGFLQVTGGGACVISYSQQAGGNNSPFYIGAIAFKIS